MGKSQCKHYYRKSTRLGGLGGCSLRREYGVRLTARPRQAGGREASAPSETKQRALESVGRKLVDWNLFSFSSIVDVHKSLGYGDNGRGSAVNWDNYHSAEEYMTLKDRLNRHYQAVKEVCDARGVVEAFKEPLRSAVKALIQPRINFHAASRSQSAAVKLGMLRKGKEAADKAVLCVALVGDGEWAALAKAAKVALDESWAQLDDQRKRNKNVLDSALVSAYAGLAEHWEPLGRAGDAAGSRAFFRLNRLHDEYFGHKPLPRNAAAPPSLPPRPRHPPQAALPSSDPTTLPSYQASHSHVFHPTRPPNTHQVGPHLPGFPLPITDGNVSTLPGPIEVSSTPSLRSTLFDQSNAYSAPDNHEKCAGDNHIPLSSGLQWSLYNPRPPDNSSSNIASSQPPSQSALTSQHECSVSECPVLDPSHVEDSGTNGSHPRPAEGQSFEQCFDEALLREPSFDSQSGFGQLTQGDDDFGMPQWLANSNQSIRASPLNTPFLLQETEGQKSPSDNVTELNTPSQVPWPAPGSSELFEMDLYCPANSNVPEYCQL